MDEPRPNYFGAAVFWLYIIAALVFTSIVISTIIGLKPPQDAYQEIRRSATTRFVLLAALSFITLSFNMMSVLIQSYILWSRQSGFIITNDFTGTLRSVWNWSIHSTLFLDFGEAIVADEARFLWVLGALFATMAVCTYMAVEGYRRRVPQLWTFFALSQILPISFAQNLFYLALVRSPHQSQAVAARPWMSAILLSVYSLGISLAPQTAGTAFLVPLIIAARLMLVAQLALVKTGSGSSSGGLAQQLLQPRASFAFILAARQLYSALQVYTPGEIGAALVGHPAVSSLGIDFLLSAFSCLTWMGVELPEAGTDSNDGKKAS